ncbi:transcriptional regulator, LysR family [Methanocaldococcus infernus ME]|uniref:Transcriptional regulator, LysR family n=2 Tax=Methanocaldococcus infernus TaxID=67760 RepID=D5VTN2_METIM|nr:transcriptional regulator, LysR family [Methanocaldococcus infernus ME]
MKMINLTKRQIEILLTLYRTRSQKEAAKVLNISPSALNVQLKRMERKLGFKLYYSTSSGTVLTEKALAIIDNYLEENLNKKFVVSGYISGEFGKKIFDNLIITSFGSALTLLRLGLVNILGIDDPYWLYRLEDERFIKYEYGSYKLDIVKTFYDKFIMVSKDNFDYRKLIGIRYSAQRIVYNILKEEKIKFKVLVRVESPFKAIEYLNKGYSMFINESFLKYLEEFNVGYPAFYEKTTHAINFVRVK